MKINRKKSGIMFVKKRNSKINATRKNLQEYPIVEEYKYLGIWFDDKLTFENHIRRIKEKIEKGMRLVDIMKWKKASSWKRMYA